MIGGKNMSGMYVDIQKSNSFLRKVFLYMIVGIVLSVVTPISLYFVAPKFLGLALQYYRVLVIVELIAVFTLSFRVYKMSSGTVKTLFVLYSMLNGLTLCTIGFLYDPMIVLYSFGITLSIFTVSAFYGFKTTEDLASYSRFFTIGLVSLILVSLVNLWLGVSSLYWMITVGGTVLFTGLIAYDVNRIRNMSFYLAEEDGEDVEKYAVMGALSLYLDFINLFLYILRFSGKKR
ncbi:hypothetical protein FSBG_00256 [Fusobacterium gonidiaformans 3-1-5R]|uniref:Inner membrane protein YbhL n=3 Tax=Fusobacteriaceae TaxID=203492 RepID=E5BF78_9FUSO|nr:hypothetical protein FSBG_00256 [Fusobacterium gonidiaformans 3-1-5R]KXA14353.1 hypothetical protein HMPREF3206_01038 [Fusobacterium equinum]